MHGPWTEEEQSIKSKCQTRSVCAAIIATSVSNSQCENQSNLADVESKVQGLDARVTD